MTYKKRTFVSFDEPCKYQCKHCYTYGINRTKYRTNQEIVESIKDDDFDIIYVSQKNDNFSNPQRGLELCEQLFEKYHCSLVIITRNVFSKDDIDRLILLKKRMNSCLCELFVAVSLNAIKSINICEKTNTGVPSPEDRIRFLNDLGRLGINTMLFLRPIMPSEFIPTSESFQIINEVKETISAVVVGMLGVNSDVLSRVGLTKEDFKYLENYEYLQGAIETEMDFIDVDKEICEIKSYCKKHGIPCFEHSMPAINYLSA